MIEQLIRQYFLKNYKISEIRDLLLTRNEIIISISTIKRILSSLGLKRKNVPESSMQDIVSAIIKEIYSCGYNLGYRSLWKKLKLEYNLTVKRDTSVKNQRIESYWGRMRQHTVDFYIQFFKCMQEKGLFDGSNLHIKCLQFCFGPLIRHDLNTNRKLWNEHRIRKQAVRNHLAGRPNVLFHLPHRYASRDYRRKVNPNTVEKLMNKFTKKPKLFERSLQMKRLSKKQLY
ncbi:Protein of unknown function, partial [Cotesia congregata]